VNSLKELIAYARAHPGKLNYGSAGVGAANHLLTEYVKQATGTEMVHIPYKSDAEVVHELIGGAIDFAVVGSGSVVQFVNDRKVKPLAVAGSRRTKLLPDVPLASESDVNELKALGSYVFYGLVGPAGMSAAVVRTLGDAVEKAGRMPETVQQFEKLYINPSTASAAEFRARTEKELVIWRGVGENLKGAS
jgi:tripartite-type tricarboxylate transporter receptor subunit TctC